MSGVFRRLSLQVKPGKSKERGESTTPSTSRESSPSSSGKAEDLSRRNISSTKHADRVSRSLEPIERVNDDKRRSTLGQEIMSKPRALAGKLHLPGRSPSRSSIDRDRSDQDVPKNRDGEDMSKNQIRKHERQQEKEAKASRQERQTAEIRQRREQAMKAADSADPPAMREKYGWAPVNNYSGLW